MPKDKDKKRLVRARMRKTGESYTAARAQLARQRARPGADSQRDLAAIAGMSDAAVEAKTGRTWAAWVRALDAVDAASRPHREIAAHLHAAHGLPGWWAQTVTVGYERIRGLRARGQRRGGGWEVNKSKTLPVPIAELYAAFGASARRRWMGDLGLSVSKATPRKSLRLRTPSGQPVEAYFWEKGPARSQVQLQHRELPSQAEADRARAQWTRRLAALAELLNVQR